MRIQPNDIIAGQPALAIRKLMQGEQGTIDTIAETLKVDTTTAENIFQELRKEGYIELSEQHSRRNKDNKKWHTTMKGNALANATARKPITRKTAERILNEFLQRVKEVNACNDYAYYIKKVILFGSYLSDSPTLGDIDLSLIIDFRDSDSEKRSKHLEERTRLAIKEGRQFQNTSDMVTWPYQEVMRFLKNRSSSISLHDEKREQVLSRPIPSKVLFDDTDEN